MSASRAAIIAALITGVAAILAALITGLLSGNGNSSTVESVGQPSPSSTTQLPIPPTTQAPSTSLSTTATPASSSGNQGGPTNGARLVSYSFDLPQAYGAPLGLAKPALSTLTYGYGGDVYFNGTITTNRPDILIELPGDPTPTYQACADGNTLIESSAVASQGTTFCIKENGRMAGVTVSSMGTTQSGAPYLELDVTIWKN